MSLEGGREGEEGGRREGGEEGRGEEGRGWEGRGGREGRDDCVIHILI